MSDLVALWTIKAIKVFAFFLLSRLGEEIKEMLFIYLSLDS